jgi:hypothetical protein
MNAGSLTCFYERAIYNPKNSASRVSVMFFAPLRLRLRAVCGSGEVKPFAALQRGALLCSGFFGSNFSEASLTNLFPRFRSANVSTVFAQLVGMFGQVFVASKTLKVFHSVVGFVSVNVVDLLFGVKRFHPTCRNNSVHKPLATQTQIAHIVFGGCIGKMISENFPTARDCVNVVKKSVLDSVYNYADHAVLSGVI